MFHSFKTIVAAAALATVSFAADAATYSASTQVGGAGGIGLSAGDNSTIFQVTNGAYSSEVTNPDSLWVWAAPDQPGAGPETLTFIYTFTLAAGEAAHTVLEGLWGVDNTGVVKLNGTQIAALSDVVVESFNVLHGFGATTGFNDGVNTLTFELANYGGAPDLYNNPAAFRASVNVTVAPVPLPASLPLLAGAVAAFGFVARRKRNA